MKKIIFFTFVLFLILSGCGKKDNTNSVTKNGDSAGSSGKEQLSMASCADKDGNLMKQACYERVFINQSDQKFCDSLSIKDDGLIGKCRNLIIIRQAWNQGDAKICDQISDAFDKNNCLREFGQDNLDAGSPMRLKDLDGDGLFDSAEKIIGSNPNNPDTDGDGYKDGDEVKNGYDPLKPGSARLK